MSSLRPLAELPTHAVTNQVPPLEDVDLLRIDLALREAVAATAGTPAIDRMAGLSATLTTAEVLDAARQCNQQRPLLRTHDRSGHRIDEVEFHPGYHQLFELAMRHSVHSAAWTPGGSHVLHAGLEYLFGQVEQGICCPLTMTYAVVPALRHQPALAATWEPLATSNSYDPRCLPVSQKRSATLGMAMTEKQGGSDVRANTTRAAPIGSGGPGGAWLLTGHKWFCSAPMCDAFLTLAQADGGLSCFLVPRWQPDGTRNRLFIQRLKDKLGNHSNASSEIEYHETFAWMVGPEGRGVRTILEMVHHTRLDCTLAAAGLVRQSLVQAIHHARHRRAFGALLIHQPLMGNVLADLALDSEAFTWLFIRIAAAYDAADSNPEQAAFARIAVAIGKYWTNRRCAALVVEAMECLGGAGYVEETVLPRLYREAPLNSIWEGSGNVICLDVLRAIQREPASLAAFMAELRQASGVNRHLDAAIRRVERELADTSELELRARRIVEAMALALIGSLVVRQAPPAVADAWCATRLGGEGGVAMGTLPPGADVRAILARAWPE